MNTEMQSTQRTILQTASYCFITDGEELQHGAAYLPLHPDHGAEFDTYNDDGTEQWTIEGVISERIEQLFDTDAHVKSYYQIAPLLFEDEAGSWLEEDGTVGSLASHLADPHHVSR